MTQITLPALGRTSTTVRSATLKSLAFFILPASAFLLVASRFWPMTIDDAYISARYAWNAAHGTGLVFNPGERIMGYTNLLLVLLETAVYAVGGDGILAAKVTGIAAAISLLAIIYGLARELDPLRWRQVGTIAIIPLILFPDLAIGAVIGLESALFAALFLASLWIFVRWPWQGKGGLAAQLALAVSLFFATLTRPEGLGMAFFLLAAQLITFWQNQKPTADPRHWAQLLARFLLWPFVFALLLSPVLLWLYNYYGSPIPNTFFAKTAAGVAFDKYRAGLAYIAYWLNTISLVWLPLLVWPFLQRHVAATTRLVGLLILYWLAYVTYTGGDWMPGFRFLLPVLPLIYLVGTMGSVLVWQSIRSGLNHLTQTAQRLLAVLLLCVLWIPALNILQSRVEKINEQARGYQQAHQEIARWLAEATPPTTTVALMDVGMIGFGSQRRVLDIAGLVNREVASLMHADGGWIVSSTPTAKRIADYTLAHQPEVIILVHNSTPEADFLSYWSHDTAIYHHPQFQAEYKLLFVRRHSDSYHLSVYARKDLSLAPLSPVTASSTDTDAPPAPLFPLN